jgi:hypothetical protein
MIETHEVLPSILKLQPMKPRTERIHYLDLIKTICILFILVYHTTPLRFGAEPAPFTKWIMFVNSIFMYNISLTAVPSFYLVSMVLFYSKGKNAYDYRLRRIYKVTQVFVFWTIIQILFYLAIGESLDFSFRSIIKYIILGGPALPLAGDSVFYFLFNLIFIYLFAHFLMKLPERFLHPFLITLICLSLAIFELAILAELNIPYWFIGNFVIYMPLAFLIESHEGKKDNKKLIYWSGLIFLTFATHERLLQSYYSLKPPAYGRISIVAGAVFLYLLAKQYMVYEWKPVHVISVYSLGIFATHKFSLYLTTQIMTIGAQMDYSILGFKPMYMITSISAIFVTFGVVYSLKLLRLDRYIS